MLRLLLPHNAIEGGTAAGEAVVGARGQRVGQPPRRARRLRLELREARRPNHRLDDVGLHPTRDERFAERRQLHPLLEGLEESDVGEAERDGAMTHSFEPFGGWTAREQRVLTFVGFTIQS